MRRTYLLTILIAVLALFSAAAAQAGGANKVNVCHRPPGNPDNWHTITIGENALQAHLNHGDLPGTCEENCDFLCDDGDPCTQDVDPYPAECTCFADRPPVDCDDTNLCTADSCDSYAGGCINAPIDCTDTDLCTVDSCDPLTGNCVNTPVACGLGELCDPDTGDCFDPCAGVICEPLDQCHVAGTCTDGDCDDPLAADGTECNDGNSATIDDACTAGVCEGTPDPCFGVVCEPLDQCHVAGTCTDGVCSNPFAPAGTVCDDDDVWTEDDVCDGAGGCSGIGCPCADLWDPILSGGSGWVSSGCDVGPAQIEAYAFNPSTGQYVTMFFNTFGAPTCSLGSDPSRDIETDEDEAACLAMLEPWCT